MQSFLQLAVCVAQLAQEVGRIAPLRPRFGNIRANRAGRSPNLVRQGVICVLGPLLAESEEFLLDSKGSLVGPQGPETSLLCAYLQLLPTY